MAKHLKWEAHYSVGHDLIDAQHRRFVELCNALADCLEDAAGGETCFDRHFAEMMDEARKHFATEEALLVACGYPHLDDQRSEQEEFTYLASEIATTENFDRQELLRFVTLWWAGHVVGAARSYPEWLRDKDRTED